MTTSLKHRAKALFRSVKSDIKALEETGLFQPDWYLATYPEAAESSLSPIEHYVRVGEKKGFDPNPWFDVADYLRKSAAARRFPAPAPVHYARKAWRKGKNPSRRFSVNLYLQMYEEVKQAGIEPLRHYLQVGKTNGHTAFHARFEDSKHQQTVKDMAVIARSGLFMADWYQATHTVLWQSDMEPLFHFITRGAKKLMWPNPFFDTGWYVETYGEQIGDMNPLAHYVTKGAERGLWPGPNFSPELYKLENDDIDFSSVDPLTHYLTQGIAEKRRFPSPDGAMALAGSVDHQTQLPLPRTMRDMMAYERKPLAPDERAFNSTKMNIHWVVPDFSPGAGGHMTIFRMAHYLELAGHQLTIWINDPRVHKTPEAAYDDIVKYFQHFAGKVKFVDDSFTDATGDALIATDCWTVWPSLSAANFKRRFYFVQDYEPSFHPMGSHYLAAEATYKEDLDCICAGPWLEKLMQEKYGRWARHFWLAADRNIYSPPSEPRSNPVPRIAFYARHFTARRAVELAMLALEELARREVSFEVDFFGARLNFTAAPFPFIDHGVATPRQLADLFRQADVGVVFSATNYSLVPQEMMASELPLVELKGDNTTCIFPEETVSLAEPDPLKIADALEALLTNPEKRQAQARAGAKWVEQFSWPASARLVEEALQERLAEFADDAAPVSAQTSADAPPKASVVIPTLNAGPILRDVLRATTSQRAPWDFEILVIDSGSTDETLDIIAEFPIVKLHEIDKKDFNHGDTRNLGVELTQGDFIAFLTHDALPANERWLFNLVSAIEHFPNAAGAFGKHLAWPDASPYTKRDLNAHFDHLATQPLYLTRDTNPTRFKNNDPHWMQLLHFYSDNNSCMRRDIWKEIPYRRTKFGEDQLWADDIIKAGYGKVYAAQAIVYHSHDFEKEENYERNKTESAFFKHFFGYELIKNDKELEKNITSMNENDTKWGRARGLDEAAIAHRCRLNEARLKGYLDGVREDTEGLF